MICEHCGAVFCPDNAPPPPAPGKTPPPPQRYCDRQCAKHASARRSGAAVRQRERWHERQKLSKRCTGKIRHKTKNDATWALWRLQYRVDARNGGIYECADCGGWHVYGGTGYLAQQSRSRQRA